ncbi:hypothetical protein [Dyadobacter sp. LHD-138]|uniref:ligand-binding sensor domain-containing protein n=1 Tax=Dyadobacter sp. LHD-138 TaxID=3071413 RepID=UPI0027DF166A|nr:hypothetical protein [Dyadobacter sp. LHD-138]MDQ6480564.1 hypothetical protein [Dyadobacter sp. LHD-138]
MPQNTVQDFTFGDYGFLWIATQGGLVRFDGKEMITYSRKDLSLNSDRYVVAGFDLEMGTGILTAITEHRQRVMIKGGTALKDPRTKTEQTASIRYIQSQLLSKKIRFDTIRNVDDYLQYKIIGTGNKRFFIYTDQKVVFFENGKLTDVIPFKGLPYFKPLPSVPHIREQVVSQTKQLVCLDNFMGISNNLFYHQGSKGVMLLKISRQGTTPLRLRGDIEQNQAFDKEKDRIRIITNRFHGQAFAYLRGSIYQILYRKSTGKLDTRLLIEDLDIDKKLIHRMIYDEGNGTLFLGSVSQGLFVARPNLFQIVGQPAKKEFNSFFYAHLPYSDSSVVIPEGFVVSSSGASPLDKSFLKLGMDGSGYGMLRDTDGDIWSIGTHAFFRLSPQGKLRNRWPTGTKQPERLYQGMDSGIWIGYRTGELSYLSNYKDISQPPPLVTKFNGKCTFLHQDRPGRLWVGTSAGLYLYDRLRNVTFPVRGLKGKNIRSIFHTKPDELWITTYGEGIFLLTGNRLYKMPLDDNKYLAYAHCILEDAYGYFWISANKGLFRVSRQDMLNYATGKIDNVFYLYHNKDDGFLTNEFNGGCQPCGIKLADGHFSFPSMNGLVWFKPEDIPLPDLSAPIRFEGFTLDKLPISPNDTIRLPYNYKHFTLNVRSPFMGLLTDNVEFFYSLQQSAKDPQNWERINKAERIDLYRINAGVYTLTVRQNIGFGGRHLEKRLTLIIESAWFLSWWFISLVLLVLGLAFWQGIRWHVRRLVHQNASLARKVQEHTSDLSRTLENLKASDQALQTQLHIQMRIVGAINHDLHAPLKFLSACIPRYLEQVSRQPDDPETVRLGTSIGNSTLKVYRLADDLLTFIKATYNKKGKIVYEVIQVCEILEAKIFFLVKSHMRTRQPFNWNVPQTLQ